MPNVACLAKLPCKQISPRDEPFQLAHSRSGKRKGTVRSRGFGECAVVDMVDVEQLEAADAWRRLGRGGERPLTLAHVVASSRFAKHVHVRGLVYTICARSSRCCRPNPSRLRRRPHSPPRHTRRHNNAGRSVSYVPRSSFYKRQLLVYSLVLTSCFLKSYA